MPATRAAYVAHAVRTPIGKYKGGLASVRSDDLAAHVIGALSARQPNLFEHLDHVVFGATNQAGEDTASLGGGVASVTVANSGTGSHSKISEVS